MDRFFANVNAPSSKGEQSSALNTDDQASPNDKKKAPLGVVLDKDGKPCRSCTSAAAWTQMMKQSSKGSTASEGQNKSSRPISDSSSSSDDLRFPSSTSTSISSTTPPADDRIANCPPDVEVLGRSTWTFLHALSGAYPTRASKTQQSEMREFLHLFSRLYPCWHCAEDFRTWIRKPGNEPRLEGQDALGRWMCEAHNDVNRKLGKKEFDCALWKQRWVDGPNDGRCD